MRRKSYLLILGISLLTYSRSEAQKRIYVNEYLNIGVGGRGLAMAGTQSAVANDVTAAYYNPAGLLQIENDFQIGLMHADYFSGNAKYDFGGVAMPLKGKKRAVGISVLRFAVDDIPYTLDYIQPDGSFDESKLKSITAGDYAFLLSYAQGLKIFRNKDIDTRIGGNAKIIYRHIGSMANAWGIGVDIGLQADYKRWHFGLMMKDITTTYTSWSFNLTEHEKEVYFNTGNEILVKSYEIMYPRFNIGVAHYFTKPGKNIQVMAAVDADITTDGKRNTLISSDGFSIDPHAGLEASYKNVIFLRAGLGNIQRVLDDKDTTNRKKITLMQPSIGAGFRLAKTLNIDYAYTTLQTQSNPLMTHVVSVRLDINRAAKAAKKPDALPPTTTP